MTAARPAGDRPLVTGLRLWWRVNDGLGGHVWLSPGDLGALRDEMALQGMADLADRIAGGGRAEILVEASEIGVALERAAPLPVSLPDRSLWEDWLRFLEGAAAHGGLLVRP